MSFDTSVLKSLILSSLKHRGNEIAAEYAKNKREFGIGYVAIDNLLPDEVAQKIATAFDPRNEAWREMDSFREKKLTSKQFNKFDSILGEITFAFQDPEIVAYLSELVGIQKQIPDKFLYAGGLSMMRKGDFLDPHIDNSHEQSRKYYRRLNLLYYVTPDWKVENGGNLELWNDPVDQKVTIASLFNRLVLMETHNRSWHSVSNISKESSFRKCVSNYYFSEESPNGEEYYHITSFAGRPEQPFKRLLSKIDNRLRTFVRKVKPDGVGKVDLYK